MVWTVELTDTAEQQLARLDRSAQRRISDFLIERVAIDDDPRRLAVAMQGEFRGLWRLRVGDYRLICEMNGERLRVLVLKIGHRRDVYR